MPGGASPRRRGDRFERRARDTFEAAGWLVVRSGGSLGPCDLVAMRDGLTLLISCKINGRALPAERAALHQAATTAGAIAVVAYRKSPGWLGLWRLHETPNDRIPMRPMRMPPTRPTHDGES